MATTVCHLPFFGVEPVIPGVQHTSHIDKTMAIASTAFVPNGKGMTAGGRAFRVSLVRVGQTIKADRNTYKRVYRANTSERFSLSAAGSNAANVYEFSTAGLGS
jgi:hypothetical protein